MAALSASTWGDPTATKRVLLIHGITASSQCWYRIAQEFASRGKFHTEYPLIHPYIPTSTQVTSSRHPICSGMEVPGVVQIILLPRWQKSSDPSSRLPKATITLITSSSDTRSAASSRLPYYPFSSPYDRSRSFSSIHLLNRPQSLLPFTGNFSATGSGTPRHRKFIMRKTRYGRRRMRPFVPWARACAMSLRWKPPLT